MLEALQSLNALTATVQSGSEEMRHGNATLVDESQNVKNATGQIRSAIDGVADHRPPAPGPVHDVTGAGDALAAGFLLRRCRQKNDGATSVKSNVGATQASTTIIYGLRFEYDSA